VAYTSRALSAFEPLWSSNLSFSLHLVSEFIDDVDHFTSTVGEPANDKSNTVHLEKIISLLSIFATVFRCLNPSPDDGFEICTKEFLDSCVHRVLRAVPACLSSFGGQRRDELLLAANDCLSVLLPICELTAETLARLKEHFALVFVDSTPGLSVEPDTLVSHIQAFHVVS
jgi:hypothetical protein